MTNSTQALEELLRCCTALHIDAQRMFYGCNDYHHSSLDDEELPQDIQFQVSLGDVQKQAWKIYDILRDRLHELPPSVTVSVRRLAYSTMRYRDQQAQEDELREEFDLTPSLIDESDKCLREIEDAYHSIERSSLAEELTYTFPDGVFPPDVTKAINSMYGEALTGFENGCLTSAIAMSGKVIETVLNALYTEVTGGDADQEKLGADALINRFKKAGYPFKGTLKEQLGIVKVHRNKAVHGSVIVPTVDETRGVLSLARDVLQKSAIPLDKAPR